jgi:phosphatidylglycerol:prolipoprotein diacylglycerol transferase
MHPIIWQLGTQPLYSYTLSLYIGILLGLGLSWWQGRQWGIARQTITGAAVCGLTGALLAGRLVYMLPQLDHYLTEPKLIGVWGNQLFPAALLGGLGMLALYALFQSVSFWRLADLAALGVPVGQTLGWLGALLHGAAYGRVTYAGYSWELPDLYGVVRPRFPTQAVGIVIALVTAALLWSLRQRAWPAGRLFAMYLSLNSLGYFSLAFSQAPVEATDLGPLSLAQWLYLGELALGVVILVKKWPRSSNATNQREDSL